jgi:hypothetical protein
MPIRNPFARRPAPANGLEPGQEDGSQLGAQYGGTPGFERVDTVGSKASSMSISSSKSQEPAEYKLSGMHLVQPVAGTCAIPSFVLVDMRY